jgi:thymidylate synthase
MNIVTTASDAWLAMIADVRGAGEIVAPAGKRCSEILSYYSEFDMRYPLVAVKPRKLSYKYAFGESWWILSGKDDVASIAPYNKKIAAYSDDGVTFFGAYGPQVIAQIEDVCRALWEDTATRRACMTIWRPNPPHTKDYPCTMALQWIIRGGKLHCIDTMRSSDAWLGWPYDVFTFTMVTAVIQLRLRDMGVRVELGQFRLIAGSQHIYESDWGKVRDVCLEDDMVDFTYAPFDPLQFDNAIHLLMWLRDVADGNAETTGMRMTDNFKEVYGKIKPNDSSSHA